MRKGIAIGILFVFLLNTLGGLGILLVHRTIIHQHISDIFATSAYQKELLHFTLNESDQKEVKWLDDKHEFEWHGQLYDVVQRDAIESKLDVYCIADNKEEFLFNKIEHELQCTKGQHSNGHFALQFLGFLNGMYFVPTGAETNCVYEKQVTVFHTKQQTLTAFLSITCEPPDVG